METINTAGMPANNTEKPTHDDATYVPLQSVNDASRDDATSQHIVAEAENRVSNPAEIINTADRAKTVVITEDDKSRFIDSVVKGTRFYGYANLFGGNLRVKFRSRTIAETEAIMAYVHRKGVTGELVTRADVSDSLLSALLVAQVEEVGDVSYPEMRKPYKYVETGTSLDPPGWIADLDMWRSKPEHITSAIGDALIDFEAKYWKMLRASKDENFWNPG